MPFSSLMFLSPSPPRLTRRSRLEHWLLLAAAGGWRWRCWRWRSRGRSWRQPAQASDADADQRRVAIVVDTSASMRRGDLWQQAVRAVDEAIAACRPQDQVGVFACDETLRPIASFEDLAQVRRRSGGGRWSPIGLAQLEPDVGGDAPGAGTARRGGAGQRNARRHRRDGPRRAADRAGERHADGSRLNVLGDSPWPDDVQLELKRVTRGRADQRGPVAAGRRCGGRCRDWRRRGEPRELRIRVANAADSDAEQFQLNWTDAAGVVAGPAIDAYVPAGESRVVRVRAAGGRDQPTAAGAAGRRPASSTTRCISSPTSGGSWSSATSATTRRTIRRDCATTWKVRWRPIRDARRARRGLWQDWTRRTSTRRSSRRRWWSSTKKPIGRASARAARLCRGGRNAALRAYRRGRRRGARRRSWASTNCPSKKPRSTATRMLGEIDFAHPLFAAMAGPRFNDFTQIRFWKYRRVDLSLSRRTCASWRGSTIATRRSSSSASATGRLIAYDRRWQPERRAARTVVEVPADAVVRWSTTAAAPRDFRADYVVNRARAAARSRRCWGRPLTVTQARRQSKSRSTKTPRRSTRRRSRACTRWRRQGADPLCREPRPGRERHDAAGAGGVRAAGRAGWRGRPTRSASRAARAASRRGAGGPAADLAVAGGGGAGGADRRNLAGGPLVASGGDGGRMMDRTARRRTGATCHDSRTSRSARLGPGRDCAACGCGRAWPCAGCSGRRSCMSWPGTWRSTPRNWTAVWSIAGRGNAADGAGLLADCHAHGTRSARDRASASKQAHPELGAMLLAALEQAPSPRFKRLGYLQAAVVRGAVEPRAAAQLGRRDVGRPGAAGEGCPPGGAGGAGVGVLAAGRSNGGARQRIVGGETSTTILPPAPTTRWRSQPGNAEIERGTTLLVIAKFRGRCRRMRIWLSSRSARLRRRAEAALRQAQTADGDVTAARRQPTQASQSVRR